MPYDPKAALIRSRLRPATVAFDETLRYFAAHSGSGLGRLNELIGSDAPPYWARLWPGGAALMQFFRERPQSVIGKRVLDLGCGSGLVGITAKMRGAASVICSDVNEAALSACKLNAELNNVEVATLLDSSARPDVDLVAAGDVFYNSAVALSTLEILNDYAARNIDILVGDIGRACLPLSQLDEIARYPARDVGASDTGEPTTAGVFSFRRV